MSDLSTTASTAAGAAGRAPLPNVELDPAKLRAKERLDKTAEDFEAFFLSQMFEHMFDGVSTDGPFGGGQAERIYRSLMVQEYGKQVARAGGVGIADSVKREMLQLQEVQGQ